MRFVIPLVFLLVASCKPQAPQGPDAYALVVMCTAGSPGYDAICSDLNTLTPPYDLVQPVILKKEDFTVEGLKVNLQVAVGAAINGLKAKFKDPKIHIQIAFSGHGALCQDKWGISWGHPAEDSHIVAAKLLEVANGVFGEKDLRGIVWFFSCGSGQVCGEQEALGLEAKPNIQNLVTATSKDRDTSTMNDQLTIFRTLMGRCSGAKTGITAKEAKGILADPKTIFPNIVSASWDYIPNLPGDENAILVPCKPNGTTQTLETSFMISSNVGQEFFTIDSTPGLGGEKITCQSNSFIGPPTPCSARFETGKAVTLTVAGSEKRFSGAWRCGDDYQRGASIGFIVKGKLGDKGTTHCVWSLQDQATLSVEFWPPDGNNFRVDSLEPPPLFSTNTAKAQTYPSGTTVKLEGVAPGGWKPRWFADNAEILPAKGPTEISLAASRTLKAYFFSDTERVATISQNFVGSDIRLFPLGKIATYSMKHEVGNEVRDIKACSLFVREDKGVRSFSLEPSDCLIRYRKEGTLTLTLKPESGLSLHGHPYSKFICAEYVEPATDPTAEPGQLQKATQRASPVNLSPNFSYRCTVDLFFVEKSVRVANANPERGSVEGDTQNCLAADCLMPYLARNTGTAIIRPKAKEPWKPAWSSGLDAPCACLPEASGNLRCPQDSGPYQCTLDWSSP